MMNQQQTGQMHPCDVACEFMRRADMKGGEVDAYAKTYNWLQSILEGELVVLPKEIHDRLAADLEKVQRELQEYKNEYPDFVLAENRGEEEPETTVTEPELPVLEEPVLPEDIELIEIPSADEILETLPDEPLDDVESMD